MVLLVALMATIYSLISLVNHQNFRTYALDLGAYTNAMFDYAHLRWNDSAVFKPVPENQLADHFDAYLVILSPLVYILGTYTLLIVQIAALLLGGFGVYFYFEDVRRNPRMGLIAAAFFYAFFGVLAAVSSDYHSNTVAAAILPWFFYTTGKRRFAASASLLLIVLVSKENVGLWMSAVCVGLAIEHWHDPALRTFSLLAMTFSAAYFLVITWVVMPVFSNAGVYPHFHYSSLGHNFYSAAIHLISHPIDSIQTLFANHSGLPQADFVKVELHLFLMASGLWLLILKPAYLVMLLPIFFQKLYHDNYTVWGIGSQYAVEFAPVMALGVFSGVGERFNLKAQPWISGIILLLATITTVRSMDRTVLSTDKQRIRFYQKSHYTRHYDVGKVHELLKQIPAKAVVSAQSPYVPHLSLRDRVYQFPIVRDAEYLVLSVNESPYPMQHQQLAVAVDSIANSGVWQQMHQTEGCTLFRRTAGKLD